MNKQTIGGLEQVFLPQNFNHVGIIIDFVFTNRKCFTMSVFQTKTKFSRVPSLQFLITLRLCIHVIIMILCFV